MVSVTSISVTDGVVSPLACLAGDQIAGSVVGFRDEAYCFK